MRTKPKPRIRKFFPLLLCACAGMAATGAIHNEMIEWGKY